MLDQPNEPSVPPIPPIPDNLLEPISALTRAAHTVRSIIFKIADEKPELIPELLKHEDTFNLCDRVISGWRKHLGQDQDD